MAKFNIPHFRTRSPPPSNAAIKTVADLIEFNADKNPHHLFCIQMQSGSSPPLRITNKLLRDTISTCQEWVLKTVREAKQTITNDAGEAIKGSPVAIMMDSNFDLLVHLFSLIGLGIPVLLLSPRLKPSALYGLLTSTCACAIIISPRLKATSEKTFTYFDPQGQFPGLYVRVSHRHWIGQRCESIAWSGHYVSDADRNVLILHSSGTTGDPKAISQSHRYLLNFAPYTSFAIMDPIHTQYDLYSVEQEDLQRLSFSTVPMYHVFGLMSPMMALSVGKSFVLPPSGWIPSARSLIGFLDTVRPHTLLVVPSVLQDIVKFLENNVEYLRQLDYIICGGGSLDQFTSDTLVKAGVRLVNGFGSTEVGSLAIPRPPATVHDWPFFRLREDLDCSVEEIPSDGEALQYKLSTRPPGWTENHSMSNIFITNTRFPEKTFLSIQRTDDVIVLATGEKIQPHTLENMLVQHPEVRGALVFGNNRVEIGVLVEPKNPVSIDNINEFRCQIWPTIKEAGHKMVAHAMISTPNAVCVLEPGQSLPRSAKGSVLRYPAYQEFSQAINRTYSVLDRPEKMPIATSVASQASKLGDDVDMEQTVSMYVKLMWKPYMPPPSASQNLFELGMDSRQAEQLRRFLIAQAGVRGMNVELPKDIIYTHPTISKLVSSLNKFDSYDSEESFLRLKNHHVSKLGTDQATILLTGGTGALGCHLLACLAKLASVVHIICLNRRDANLTTHDRQIECVVTKGSSIPLDFSGKVEVISTDITLPYLGLSHLTYMKFAESVTHIVHSAWPVDFKRKVKSFESQFIVMSNLINFTIIAKHSPRLLFVSSIAVVEKHSARVPGTRVLVPEETFQPGWPIPTMGYAQAKLICEHMLQVATKKHSVDGIVVRCGQLAGARKNGYWTSSEYFPTLLKISHKLGFLPSLKGTFSWLPLEDAAAVLVELLLLPGDAPVYHIENPRFQSWETGMLVIADKMQLPLIPYEEWLERVSQMEGEEPLMDFFEKDFQRGTGTVGLNTSRAMQASESLRHLETVEDGLLQKYVEHFMGHSL